MNYWKALLYIGTALVMAPIVVLGWVVGIVVLAFRVGMFHGEHFMPNRGHIDATAWKAKFSE